MPIRSHRDLVVWQKAVDLAVEVYRLSALLPRDELYRITSQLTRAGVSVPANIAEGAARDSPRDYARFLAIARGSLAETETLLLICVRLGYMAENDAIHAFELGAEVGRMLTTLRQRLMP